MPDKSSYNELTQKVIELENKIADLKYHENLFREIFENAPLGILHFDNTGVITACNDQFVKIIGSSRDVLVGLNMLRLPDQRVVHALQKAMGGQISYFEGEYHSTTADKITPVRLIFNPVCSGPGKKTDGGIGIIEDVTERARAEIELRKSEKRFRDLAEMLPETIFEIDLQGNLTFVNQKAFDLFGHTHEDLADGINVLDLIQKNDRERVLANIGRILNGENIGVTEYEVLRKDGSSFPGLFHSSVITNDRSEPIGFRGFLIDITEKKRTQELLLQSEKMMSVGGLAAGMAHEINNPLAGMLQNAQVAVNRLSADLPANEQAAMEAGTTMTAIRTYMKKRGVIGQLEHITTAGHQAARIVQNMLSFARKNNPVKTPKDMAELIEKTLDLIKNDYNIEKNYDFKKIKIIRQFDTDLPLVPCEENKIQQVIINIIKNSIDAAAGIQQKPDALVLWFRLKNEQNMVRLEIEDNGPGIDSQTRKRIFEPFFSTKKVDKGTGLGLSISYFIIVDNHKGEIAVESTPGKGTNFIIRLPAE